ncbi:MAG TPA: trehalase family glycosidase [Candidatus Obscuribacterales bacterium]
MNASQKNALSDSRVDALIDYIGQYWRKLIRHNPEDKHTLIGLPRPYVVPSDGEMFQEMYYWDSFFTSLGLVGSEHEQLILDMTENLAHLFRRFGVIPNASRYYFLSRSQPPFFTKMIMLAYDVLAGRGSEERDEFLDAMMALAQEEHETVWLGERQPHHRQMLNGLSRYFDINFLDSLASCESGWDHSTRCGDRWMHHLPIDLNSILYAREIDFARAHELRGRHGEGSIWRRCAELRAEAINMRMWDKASGFFYDYDLERRAMNMTPSLAGFFPMWAGFASPAQAARMVAEWLPQFERDGGLVTSLDEMSGRQWAYPNGWAPLQWLVTEGLENYGYHAEALRIREKWCAHCLNVFEKTGAMWEKYNVVETDKVPEGGVYGSVSGFAWSNAVFVDFIKKIRAAKSTVVSSKPEIHMVITVAPPAPCEAAAFPPNNAAPLPSNQGIVI